MKTTFSLTVFAAVLFSAAGDSKNDAEQTIRELHSERIATLKSLVDLTTKLAKTEGAASHRDVLESRLLLLNAELDAAETDQERIRIQESIVESLKEFEALLKGARTSGELPLTEFFKVKAERLKAEIDLERNKSDSNKRLK